MSVLLGLVDTDDPAFPHVAKALQGMKAAGVELNEAAIEIAARLGKQQHANDERKKQETLARRGTRKSIVYYVRRGDLIKIGTTVNPPKRFNALMPDAILAFEPGGRREEARRHRQFSHCRAARKGEYFRQSTRLMSHIAALREENGPPEVTWPSIATLGTGYARTKVGVQLPEPKTGEMLTASEGAKRLGANRSTVHGWAHRELLPIAGRNEDGTALYFVEQMAFLLERNRRWMNRR